MLVSSFNLSQSFNYTLYLFYKKTVQIREQFFLYMDPARQPGRAGITADFRQLSSLAGSSRDKSAQLKVMWVW
jgi:hypothetical protein